jgi:hypothetical protein
MIVHILSARDQLETYLHDIMPLIGNKAIPPYCER